MSNDKHPMLGRRCLIRTFSAGVHIGDIVHIDNMEVHILNCIRILKWYDDRCSISTLARQAPSKIDIDFGDENYLTNVVEILPISEEANKAYDEIVRSLKQNS